MKFFNEYGGFSDDGKSYIIKLDDGEKTPAPWCNILANENFGCVISESGGGWTWFDNSREFKLTDWSCDPILDPPSEILEFESEGKKWRVTEGEREVTHSFGFTEFERDFNDFEIKETIFVPLKRNSKVTIINVKNNLNTERNIKIRYKIKPVLGVSNRKNWYYIDTFEEDNCLVLKNEFNEQYSDRSVYLTSPEKLFISTDEYFVEIIITLAPNESKEIYFELEMQKSYNIDIQAELKEVKAFWEDKTTKTKVETGNVENDILLGGWLIYQTISCRLWARSGFYQCGGAFGFRDQLQDCLAIIKIMPELVKKIILQACEHQYIEGDVQHWFHLPRRGVRTKFSDDLLWLPFVIMEYVRQTGDKGIWDEEVYFLESELLGDDEGERYENPKVSEEKASVYEHCKRVIKHSLRFGEHGLPLIGGGDWNDGFSNVGARGKGESVWMAFFLIDILGKWQKMWGNDVGDIDEIIKGLKTAANTHGWDGEWYRRAFYDDGSVMGTKGATECEIDGLVQAWAVISGGGDKDKCKIAMENAIKKLVDKENGIIKLLTTPFGDGEQKPGYIKNYAPGVRENGGQYTHAAAWLILALHRMGETAKARELFTMINPINHSDTKEKAHHYKCEPYVLCGDVWSAPGFEGVGGWSWYTGSAGWLQMVGREIFGENDE